MSNTSSDNEREGERCYLCQRRLGTVKCGRCEFVHSQSEVHNVLLRQLSSLCSPEMDSFCDWMSPSCHKDTVNKIFYGTRELAWQHIVNL